jgi:hypothetical protein
MTAIRVETSLDDERAREVATFVACTTRSSGVAQRV